MWLAKTSLQINWVEEISHSRRNNVTFSLDVSFSTSPQSFSSISIAAERKVKGAGGGGAGNVNHVLTAHML